MKTVGFACCDVFWLVWTNVFNVVENGFLAMFFGSLAKLNEKNVFFLVVINVATLGKNSVF